MVAVSVWRPEFGPWHSCKDPVLQSVPPVSVLAKRRQGHPWGLLASQSCWIHELEVSERLCLKQYVREPLIKTPDTDLWPPHKCALHCPPTSVPHAPRFTVIVDIWHFFQKKTFLFGIIDWNWNDDCFFDGSWRIRYLQINGWSRVGSRCHQDK